MPKAKKVAPKKLMPEEDLSPEQMPSATGSLFKAGGPSNFLVILLVIVSFFAGYLFFKVKSLEQGKGTVQPTGTQQEAQKPTEVKVAKPSTKEHWRGAENARYVWVEYSDFECPYCKTIHPNIKKIMDENPDKLAWVFRHYPLPFHPKAQKSAEASECAADLGGNEGFWKMADLIYEKMPDMELTALPSMASEIGLDQTAFKQCLDSGKYEKKVKDMMTEGSKGGIQATPSGVVYDLKTGKMKLVEGALPYESLKQELSAFMEK